MCTQKKSFLFVKYVPRDFLRIIIVKDNLHVHIKEKLFTCKIRFKGFSQRRHLKMHPHVHSKEKPFICEICFKGFSESGSLKKHYHVHTE